MYLYRESWNKSFKERNYGPPEDGTLNQVLSDDYEAMIGEGEQVYRNKTLEVSGMASKIYKAFQNEPVRMR